VAQGIPDLETLIVDALMPGDAERYVLPELARRRLAPRFEETPMSAPALEALLRLIVALEQTLESPSAAEAVRALVRRSPDAGPLLRDRVQGRGIDRLRAHHQREGRQVALRAPTHGARGVGEAVPLRSLFDPLAQEAARAKALGAARR